MRNKKISTRRMHTIKNYCRWTTASNGSCAVPACQRAETIYYSTSSIRGGHEADERRCRLHRFHSVETIKSDRSRLFVERKGQRVPLRMNVLIGFPAKFQEILALKKSPNGFGRVARRILPERRSLCRKYRWKYHR